ncbi:hypothetical protein BROUX41_000369 [Berkeleyomyces rouxiae]|uniref:uncharacterized protein n=1 Tax=Berkeleyomyces rouxiae TaxID=2035830 RepID=UPI003B7BBD71
MINTPDMLNLNYASDSGDETLRCASDKQPSGVYLLCPKHLDAEPCPPAAPLKSAIATAKEPQEASESNVADNPQHTAADSDNEAPEEAGSTKPVRALEKKKKRRNNKSKSNASSQHPSKRQKASGHEKENADTSEAPETLSSKAAMAEEAAVSVIPDNFCIVCKENHGKYKCPRCSAKVCCVACSKAHKENHPADLPPKPKPAPINVFIAPTQPSSDLSHPFSFLDNSAKLRALFERYPCLPDALLKISDAKQPPKPSLGTPFMQSEAKRLEKKLWDRSVGEQHGRDALRRVREQDSEEGEAVRAYSELILHLMETQGRGGLHEVRKRKTREEGAIFQKLAQAETKKARF